MVDLSDIPLITWIGIGLIAFYLFVSWGAPWMSAGGLSWLVVIGGLLAAWPFISRRFRRHAR